MRDESKIVSVATTNVKNRFGAGLLLRLRAEREIAHSGTSPGPVGDIYGVDPTVLKQLDLAHHLGGVEPLGRIEFNGYGKFLVRDAIGKGAAHRRIDLRNGSNLRLGFA